MSACAKKLLPLIVHQPHHHLLVTLLLMNSFANEALPLFLDNLVPSWAAIAISVSAVLLVGEILPVGTHSTRSTAPRAHLADDCAWPSSYCGWIGRRPCSLAPPSCRSRRC